MGLIAPVGDDLRDELARKAVILQDLERHYGTMFDILRDMHERAYADIAVGGTKTIVEVACGTGMAYPLALRLGLDYTGVDISETAIAMCCLKFTDGCFVNAPVHRLNMFADHSFDAVYCSSMLEHIGRVEAAIRELWRLARHRLDLIFYEGLGDTRDHVFTFVPYDPTLTPESWGGPYGVKVAVQDHGDRDGRTTGVPVPGYFMNRFARDPMRRLLNGLPRAKKVEMRNVPHPKHGMRSWVTVRR